MHAALQLAPVLAAEKSKTAFYIAGGVLVAWALTLSMLIGMRRPDFPRDLVQQRAVSVVTILLVAAAVSTAVLTSGGSTTAAASKSTLPALATSPAAPTTSAAPASTATAAKTTPATTAPAAAASHLQIAANPTGQLKFTTSSLTTKAGTVTMTMANMSPLEHNLTIAQGSTVLGATPTFAGGTRTLTLNLKPGHYVFYCSVPGHRQAGMEGTLTVQ